MEDQSKGRKIMLIIIFKNTATSLNLVNGKQENSNKYLLAQNDGNV